MVVVIDTTAGFTCATRFEKSGRTAWGATCAGGLTAPGWATARPVNAVLARRAVASAVRRQGFDQRCEACIQFSMGDVPRPQIGCPGNRSTCGAIKPRSCGERYDWMGGRP